MYHPVNEVGERRICPETGKRFREAYTNNLKKPWSFFNECDKCSPGHETIAQTLRRLNLERTK